MESVLFFFILILPFFSLSALVSGLIQSVNQSGKVFGNLVSALAGASLEYRMIFAFALNEQFAGVSWLLPHSSSVFSFFHFKIAFYAGCRLGGCHHHVKFQQKENGDACLLCVRGSENAAGDS